MCSYFLPLIPVKSRTDGWPREIDRCHWRRGHMHRLPARWDRRTQQEPKTQFPGGGEGHEHHGDRRDLQVRVNQPSVKTPSV